MDQVETGGGVGGGYGICPVAAVLTEAHGSIHDDDGDDLGHGVNCQQMSCGSTDNAGYLDNMNCYTTIQAPAGELVRFTFTQMNLEGPGQKPGCMPCTDPRGCDYVALYDGEDEQAPLIGTYSGHRLGWSAEGGGEGYLPSIVTTGSNLHVRFITDTHNCGIDGSEDPGWKADWDFITNGQDICHPDTAVLRDPTGTLHDDSVHEVRHCVNAQDCGTEGGNNGYGDNLDCGVRIHAPKGATVNVHFTQMNLEGGTNGICGNQIGQYQQIDCSAGGDYVEIYDGKDASAPLLGHVTGDVTDDRIQADTFTSSHRNMFVRFVTDVGNYGLTGTTSDPGFWLEWQMIDDGQECMAYNRIRGQGIVGHNSENFMGKTVVECEELCCARDWCRSFDFVEWQGPQGPATGAAPSGMSGRIGQCSLADVDVSTNAATAGEWTSDIYEREHVAAIDAIEGDAGCASELARLSDSINAQCCPEEGCERGVPDYCSEECDTIWSPFARHCSIWLEQGPMAQSNLAAVTTLCEDEAYGRFNSMAANSNHGRCGDGDIQQWLQELGPACCGDGGDPGTHSSEHCPNPADPAIGVPMPTNCTPQCADMFEEMYAECHPRFEAMGIGNELKSFLAMCQVRPAAC